MRVRIKIKRITYDLIEENNVLVYRSHRCECPCNARIPFKKIHKNNGIPRFINKHQNQSLEIQKKNSDSNKGKIPHNKGISYDELYGKEKSAEIKRKIGEKSSANKIGKTFIDIYGNERARKIKDKIRQKRLGTHPTQETLAKMSASQSGRKHKQSSIDKMKEKRKLQVITEETKRKIRETQKGRTLEDIHGNEKATELKKHFSQLKRGKSYDELYGKEKSSKLRKCRRIEAINRIQKNKGLFVAYNKQACEFFKSFDKQNDTKGQYALYGGGEYYIKELGYFLDYINFDKKLIIEWDENHHFYFDGKLRKKDVQRQKEIEEYFSDFEFRRIRERDVK